MKSIMEEASTITKAIENAWNRAGQPQEFTVKVLELPKTSFFGLKTAKSAKIALLFNEMTVTVKTKEQHQKQVRPLAPRQPHDRRDHREPALRQETDRHPDRTDRPERSQQPQRRPLPREQQQRDPQRDAQRAERPERPERPERSQDNRQNARPDQRRTQQAPRQPYRSEGQGSEESRQPYRSESHGSEEPRRHEPRNHERETWAPEMVEAAQDWVKETLVLMGKPEIKINPHVSHNYLKLYLDQPVMDDYKQEETQLKSWGSLAMEAVREKTNKPLRSLRIILESKR